MVDGEISYVNEFQRLVFTLNDGVARYSTIMSISSSAEKVSAEKGDEVKNTIAGLRYVVVQLYIMWGSMKEKPHEKMSTELKAYGDVEKSYLEVIQDTKGNINYSLPLDKLVVFAQHMNKYLLNDLKEFGKIQGLAGQQ